MRISIVQSGRVRPLRNLVLRPGLPIETTYYKQDNDIDTIHLASLIKKLFA